MAERRHHLATSCSAHIYPGSSIRYIIFLITAFAKNFSFLKCCNHSPLINKSLSNSHLQELAGVLFIRSRSQAEDHPQLLLGRPQEEGHVLLEPQSILKNNSISFLLSERLRQVFGCGFSPRWAPVSSLRWNFHRKRPFSSQFLKIIKKGPKPQNRWLIKILGQSTKSSTGDEIRFCQKLTNAQLNRIFVFCQKLTSLHSSIVFSYFVKSSPSSICRMAPRNSEEFNKAMASYTNIILVRYSG